MCSSNSSSRAARFGSFPGHGLPPSSSSPLTSVYATRDHNFHRERGDCWCFRWMKMRLWHLIMVQKATNRTERSREEEDISIVARKYGVIDD
ncbi:unnamed protein product [Linum trigynum]|uniref:Uncharacterized protein n=1 Tax=Linum trigynum TaxID=586398 RepID=A0AAV2FRY4_9ROSI